MLPPALFRVLRPLLLLPALLAGLPALRAALPGTAPLAPHPDLSAEMIAGIDRMADRLLREAPAHRRPDRAKLAALLGLGDPRVPFAAFALVGDTAAPAELSPGAPGRVQRVRWPALAGVHGEGLRIVPAGAAAARVILIPDADTAPEKLAGPALLGTGCEIVIPALLDRDSSRSTNPRFEVRTNVPHREWIYRQTFPLGRHPLGLEVQKILALVDRFRADAPAVPVVVAGVGEGGLIALLAAALETRIDAVAVGGSFGPREELWREPLERNLFGFLRDFGDAELAALVAPRRLAVLHRFHPEYTVDLSAPAGRRALAAPGRLTAPPAAAAAAEVERARTLRPGNWIRFFAADQSPAAALAHVLPAAAAAGLGRALAGDVFAPALPIDPDRRERFVREGEQYAQGLIPETERGRQQRFWRALPMASVPAYEAHIRGERERFWRDAIGRLPDPDVPANPRSRYVRTEGNVAIYEVVLDVWSGVIAWGWLCLPLDLVRGDPAAGPPAGFTGRRPVVVCQHGLEGLPEDTVATDPARRASGIYRAFALRLAQEGFVTFAPHNPYRGRDAFRVLQRKLQPLGLSLFSVINGQHQRILDWLQAQPFVAADRIAFYGLSYGGKTAMRTPAVLPGYCLSICSGDFNEWIRKTAGLDTPMSYLHAAEHEIWEWNLAGTFGYAEMAALIAPRPFMVERGHDDGVGLDEWVNYEFAKVRRLYDRLGLGQRARIAHFDGGHRIDGTETFAFLRRELGLETFLPARAP